MWKINCWLASLSATDTHFNSAVLRQLHVPAYPAPRSWHFPLVPLKSGFIVPGAGGRNKRMPELWAGWQRLRNSSWARRGPLTPRSEGRTPRSAPCPRRAMPRPRCPPGARSQGGQLGGALCSGDRLAPAGATSRCTSCHRPPRARAVPPPVPLLPILGAVLGKQSFTPRQTLAMSLPLSLGLLEALGARLRLPGQHKCSSLGKMMNMCFSSAPDGLLGIILSSFSLPPRKRETFIFFKKR